MNQQMENLLERIKRIKALAEKGVGGEKETAQATLKRLMKKHNITEYDLSEEVTELEWFRYKDKAEFRLLCQIMYMVTGDGETWRNKDKRYKLVACYCTKAEKIEIQANFDFYMRAMRKEMSIFFDAFMQKNNLFPEKAKNKESCREPDLERILKMKMMMQGMDVHTRLKEIKGREKE